MKTYTEMTREDIKQHMADAGLKTPARGDFIFIHWDQIEMLIAHERADEREACAEFVKKLRNGDDYGEFLAAAIRARGNT